MHLNLFIQSRGHHEAAWRHPQSSKLPLTDIDYTVEMTKKAEAGLFDSIFLADVLGLWNDVQTTPFNWLEPITTLAALSMVTKRIGLIATASTTYTEPFNLARYFASLDHISRGPHRLEHRHHLVVAGRRQLRRHWRGEPRRPLRARRRVHERGERPVGFMGRRCRAR